MAKNSQHRNPWSGSKNMRAEAARTRLSDSDRESGSDPERGKRRRTGGKIHGVPLRLGELKGDEASKGKGEGWGCAGYACDFCEHRLLMSDGTAAVVGGSGPRQRSLGLMAGGEILGRKRQGEARESSRSHGRQEQQRETDPGQPRSLGLRSFEIHFLDVRKLNPIRPLIVLGVTYWVPLKVDLKSYSANSFARFMTVSCAPHLYRSPSKRFVVT